MRMRSMVLACVLLARLVHAQDALLPAASWSTAPSFTYWKFGTEIAQQAGGLQSIAQIAFPVRGKVSFGSGRWNLEGATAFASSIASVRIDDAVGDLNVSGLTDIRLRLSGALIPERLVLTAGVNVPTGKTSLNAEQASVLQMVGAPALGLPVPALGVGAGGTLGLVGARQAGPWAIALGASGEMRSEYTAVELAIADGGALTKIAPGAAWHVTLGGDRSVGQHRLALMIVTDGYSEDKLGIASDGGTTQTRYKLGPQLTGAARLDIARGGWREGAASLSVRHRSAFTDDAGEQVDGSSANYLEGSLFGIRGAVTGRGLILGIDARYQSGMSFSDALVAAAASTAGATAGVELPGSSMTLRIAARIQYGTFDTGVTQSSGFGVSLTGVVAGRR